MLAWDDVTQWNIVIDEVSGVREMNPQILPALLPNHRIGEDDLAELLGTKLYQSRLDRHHVGR